MHLQDYLGKKVEIICIDYQKIIGEVIDYFYPEDNVSNEESIIIETPMDGEIEVYVDETKTIKEVQ